MNPQEPDGPLPVGELIRERREALMPPVSQRQAARLTGMSDSTWQALESGRRATRGTIAAAALLTGVTPRELEDRGRPDAATALRTLMQQKIDETGGIPGALRDAVSAAARAGVDAPMVEIAQGLADIENSRDYLTRRQRDELRDEFIAGIARDAGERRASVRAVLRVAQSGV